MKNILMVISLLSATCSYGRTPTFDDWWFSVSAVQESTPLWTPDFIGSSLRLWLDASQTNTIVIGDGSATYPVSNWVDKSSYSLIATNSVSVNRPGSYVETINGLNVLKFDGINDSLTLPQNVWTTTNGFTIYVAASNSTTSGYRTMVDLDPNPPRIQQFRFNSGILEGLVWRPTLTTITGSTINTNNFEIFGLVSGTNQTDLYINGNMETNIILSGNAVTTSSILEVGGRTGSPQYFSGTIGEVLVFHRPLSDVDRTLIEGYLLHKWGRSEELPIDHLYRTDAPHNVGSYIREFGYFNMEYQPSTFSGTYANGASGGTINGLFWGGVLLSSGSIVMVPFFCDYIGMYDPSSDIYSNAISSTTLDQNYAGGVLVQDDKVVLVPYNSDYVGIYDPIANTYSVGPLARVGNANFMGGVLAPDGKVILVPRDATTVGIYDPVENTYTNGPVLWVEAGKFGGGVLTTNGNIIFVPSSSDYVGIYDPISNTYSNGAASGPLDGNFVGGVLAPNGKIIFVPYNSPYVGIYDPITDTYVDGPAHGSAIPAFLGGCLMPDGTIIFAPFYSDYVGIYDPVANTYTNGPASGTLNANFNGCVLAPNGKAVLVPYYSNNIGLYDSGIGQVDVITTITHPAINKF